MQFLDMAAVVREICLTEQDPTISVIVVAHGNDIMEETAFLADLSVSCVKPVIFTGAQRAPDDIRSDAAANLTAAITAARDPTLASCGGLIAFGGRLIPASQAHKWHTTSPIGFAARDDNEGSVRGVSVTAPLAIIRQPALPPYVMTFITGIFVSAFAALFPVGVLADITNSGTLFAFAMVAIAVFVLRKSDPGRKRPFRVPATAIMAPVAVLGSAYLFLSLSIYTIEMFLGWALTGLLVYFCYGRRNSHFGKSIAEIISADGPVVQ